jgi:histidinol dehydrogenase
LKVVEGFEAAKEVLSRRSARVFTDPREPAVRSIIEDVFKRGDKALLEYTAKFDGAQLENLEISRAKIKAAYRSVSKELVSALELAVERVTNFHVMQKQRALKSYTHGKTGWMVKPIEKIGVYAPGGTATYPSSVLMSAIPAKVAGAKELILTSPAGKDGAIPASTLVAADLAGIDRVFALGGAQAIAALAFGTESVPKVDKICGPGNIYVFLAKKLLYGVVGIDGLWGPSEVVVIVDEASDANFAAADMLAQAEHDALATSILISTSRSKAEQVQKAITLQTSTAKRKEIIKKSLADKGIVALVKNIDEAIELTNLFAPEHVCLLVSDSDNYVERFTHAGCVIYGKYATEPMSDYVSGPSHVLPTEGTARFTSPLNVMDFMKITNVSRVGDTLIRVAGPAAITIGEAEGLEAHARAVEWRLKKAKKTK